MTRRQYFTAGFKDGIPICLGYIAVSFTFGIMAKKVGISIFDAVLISLTNVTSAGQFAGLSLIASTASYIEIDRKSTRLNSSHKHRSRMPSSA